MSEVRLSYKFKFNLIGFMSLFFIVLALYNFFGYVSSFSYVRYCRFGVCTSEWSYSVMSVYRCVGFGFLAFFCILLILCFPVCKD